jgi:hypothetical protein
MAKKKIEVGQTLTLDLLTQALAQIDAEQAELAPDDQKHMAYRNCRAKLQATIAHIQARLYS